MTVHFIAIGGSVMHQLAIALKNKGWQVSGSDDDLFDPAASNLAAAGLLPPSPGWDISRIKPGMDAVILGMHAREDNPELQKAKSLGIPVYSFPEYISEVSRQKTRVVIGGSHGKTTVTAMIMHVLRQTGKDFDYLVGARLEGFDQSVRISEAPILVCEGDEYPASTLEKRPKFHFLWPHIAVITGIAWDHINVFPSFAIYLEQFAEFIRRIIPGGCLIYNETDPVLKDLVSREARGLRLLPYGLPKHQIVDHRTRVWMEEENRELQVFGEHNLLNMQAAALACRELGIGVADFLAPISSFRGAAKRLELLGNGPGGIIYRDFAHAPSKVKAAVRAVRQQFGGMRLVTVLELHTFSSLSREFLDQYLGALDMADLAAVFYSEHAIQVKRLPSLKREDIVRGFGREDLHIFNTLPALQVFLDHQLTGETVLLLMSSGNFEGLDLEKLKTSLLSTRIPSH